MAEGMSTSVTATPDAKNGSASTIVDTTSSSTNV